MGVQDPETILNPDWALSLSMSKTPDPSKELQIFQIDNPFDDPSIWVESHSLLDVNARLILGLVRIPVVDTDLTVGELEAYIREFSAKEQDHPRDWKRPISPTSGPITWSCAQYIKMVFVNLHDAGIIKDSPFKMTKQIDAYGNVVVIDDLYRRIEAKAEAIREELRRRRLAVGDDGSDTGIVILDYDK